MKIRKSQPYVFLVFILAIFIIGFAYVVLTKPMQVTYNRFYNESFLEDEVYQTFYIRSKTIWNWVLLPCAVALILWAIIKMQEKGELGGFGEV